MDRKALAESASRIGSLLSELSAEMLRFLAASGMSEREAAAAILHEMSAEGLEELLLMSKKEVQRKKEG